jgi:hypothetical protein
LRFYFSDQERTTFYNDVSERQFNAVKTILSQLDSKERSLVEALVYPVDGFLDIADSYIKRRMEQFAAIRGGGIGYYHALLYRVNKQLAISLGFIGDTRGGETNESN